MAVRVPGAVVDAHSYGEDDDLKKHEDGDEPSVPRDLTRAVAEEGEFVPAWIAAGVGNRERETAGDFIDLRVWLLRNLHWSEKLGIGVGERNGFVREKSCFLNVAGKCLLRANRSA